MSPYKKIRIGRDPSCDIVIDNPTVSREHAYFITEDNVHFDLRDISVNGTFVLKPEGQVRVQQQNVGLGDRIILGGHLATVGELLAQAGVHPQVFISYNHIDRARSQTIAQFLSEHGLRVWWDPHLGVGRPFDDEVEKKLKLAASVLVLWSEHSVQSHWVRAEAGIALERGVLVPVFIDKVEPPLLFRQIQGHFVTDWETDGLHDQLAALAQKIDGFLRISR